MCTSRSFFSTKRKSFTLPELLIAIAITSILLFFFTQILDTVNRTIKVSTQLIDSTAQARFVFDRLGIDLNNMPIRSDIDYVMTNSPVDTDFLRFLSKTKGPGGDRPLSLIGYKISQSESGAFSLHRGIKGYQWSSYGFMGFSTNRPVPSLLNLPDELSLGEKDYEEISSGIFKAGIVFQYKNTGKIHRAPPMTQLTTNRPSITIQITNLASVVVTFAIMDMKYKELMTPESYDLLATKFTEAPEGITPLAHWNTNLEYRFTEFSEGIPKPVAQSIRVFQRFYNIESQ